MFCLVEFWEIFEERVDLFVVEGGGMVGRVDEVAKNRIKLELGNPVRPIVNFLLKSLVHYYVYERIMDNQNLC